MPRNPDVAAVLEHAAKAPALPAPEGRVVRVDSASALAAAIHNASDGDTVLAADGFYAMPPGVVLSASGVSIRSESGARDSVIIDGGTNGLGQIIAVVGAKEALIADLSISNSHYYGINVLGDSGVSGLSIYNVKFHNNAVRGLKGTTPIYPGDNGKAPANPPEVVERVRPRGGRVLHCLFLCDRKKEDPNDGFGGDYISGVDMQYLDDWVFADNVFMGIRGRNGGGRGAIFVWVQANDVIVERNLFINNDRSIAFGNPSYSGVSMRRGVIRDNCIVAGVNRAVECCGARDTSMYGNRIFATDMAYPLTVEFTQGSDGSSCRDNIIHGHLVAEDSVLCADNHVGSFEGVFRDPTVCDLSLTPEGKRLFGERRSREQ
ncbi:MAG: hypothetical protein JW909_09225 [Planctomycetes bacterium]|nr:hypothetical protein [Planctomycetota bacterium]